MKERPILFSAPMVRAILAGTKTQTRRVVKPQPNQISQRYGDIEQSEKYSDEWFQWDGGERGESFTCPYGAAGDRLWVREAWGLGGDRLIDPCLNYRADGTQRPVNRHKGADDLWYPYGSSDPITSSQLIAPSLMRGGWRPSIHMPRWASRIALEITDIRVERVATISGKDVGAEGILLVGNYRAAYRDLWDKINGKRLGCAWADNPWVWCVSFRRLP